ncbi:hypothetical protein PISMIDRAFT_12853 [Pisolithus microcarpus 441]|uniref:Chromatin elongation factor spt5 n=1 Tax=Pisolithus microcarpus 441 TaxID=765257 RepID=A0A0C9YV08_9AGAM|nr:hypothetical protein PISMIDRAFT_12853 [Pisolithus microcarpus 441]
MAALTKIDVELDVTGIPFDQEEWLDLIKAKVAPLLEDAAAWQLVLWWEMQDRFKERYKFNDWKTIFDQVFEASCEGTTVELVRAAMSECGVLNPPSVPNFSSSQALSSGKVSRKSDSSLPPAKHARLSKSMAWYLDVSTWEDEDNENEDGDQDNLDIRVENCPKVMERYAYEGGVTGSNVQAHQNQVPNVKSCPPSPLASAARFVLEHLKLENLPCRTFHSLPKCIFVEARNLLEVQICLPPSHNTLIKNIVLILAEEMQSITQPHDIPIQSWVHHLSGPFKNDISYVLSTDTGSVEMLVVPWEVPYYSTPQDLFHRRTLFDVDLARVHGSEVTVSTDEEGHLVASCEGREYHHSCTRFFSHKKAIKVVNVPLPDEIAWFALALIDPPLVDHTMTSFSAQWWQDRDTGRIHSGEYAGSLACVIAMDSQCESVTVCVLIPGSSDNVVKDLEISIHDFRLEFLPGTFVKVIAGMNRCFEGMVIGKVEDMVILQGNDQQASHCLVKWIVLLTCLQLEVPKVFLALHVSPTTYMSQNPHDQLFHDPLANESCIQLGDLVQVVSRPHKGLSGTLHYHSGCEILITLSTLPQESTDDPGNKGKSKAQESEVAGGDGGIDENSDLIQVSVSIDDAIIIPLSTLQLSKERGYDVSISDCVRVARGPAVCAEGPVHAVDFASGHLTVLSEDGPWHDVPISFCGKVEDYTLHDQEYHIGHEVWIISGPSKGYRGMLRSVGRTFCMVGIHLGIMQLKNTAVVTESGMLLNGTPLDSTRMAVFIALCWNLFAEIAPPPRRATPPPSLSAVDPLAEPGPSTLTSNPWIINADNVTMPCPNKTEKQQIDYGM